MKGGELIIMQKKNVVEIVEKLAQPAAEARKLDLVDVKYVKEGNRWYLRIFIDKYGGVDLNDCQELSTVLSEILDKEDVVPHSYMLEVSSPGIERPLKKPEDYERFIGERVSVRTYSALNGQKKFTGQLIGFNGSEIEIKIEQGRVVIPLEKVSKANLSPEF